MQPSFTALLERIDDFLFERNGQRFRHAAGLTAESAEAPLFARYPELADVELQQQIAELADSPRTDEARRARFRLLLAFVRRQFLKARTAELTDELGRRLDTVTVTSASKQWRLAEGLRDVPKQPTREARAQLSADLSSALNDLRTPFSRRVDTLLAATAEAKAPTAERFIEGVQGRPLSERSDALGAFLRDTDDAYRDVLNFVLKRVDPELKAGHAHFADWQRTLNAPWLFEVFRREELQHAVTRCLGDLGLHPNANGRIGIDAEARPGKTDVSRVFDARVPDEVRLVLAADAGFDAYAGAFSAWGTAQHHALVARGNHFTERRLGDPAVPRAVGRLFESFLGDEAFLKRALRLAAAPAREAARVFAFRQLAQQRRAAAHTLVVLELLKRGPVQPLANEFSQRLSAALHVEVPAARFLFDVDPFAGDALELDAWSLEQALHTTLTHRYNEDFWRNPAAGRWLSDFSAKGQRDDARAIAEALSTPAAPVALASTASPPKPLDLQAMARRRVAVMGA